MLENVKVPISVVAEMLKCHQRTLRIYDEENIIKPARSPKNRRLYSQDDIRRGEFIMILTREVGMSHNGIKLLLACASEQDIKKQILKLFSEEERQANAEGNRNKGRKRKGE